MYTRTNLCDGLIMAIKELNPKIWLTLNIAHTSSLAVAIRDLEHFFMRLEHRSYGKRWAKVPAERRLRAYAFFEHPDSNLHAHIPMAGPDRMLSMILNDGPFLWRELTRVGHGQAEAINSVEAVARYTTKCAHSSWSMESFVAYGPHARG